MRPWLVLVLALAGVPGISQTQSPAQTEHRMEITVERLENGVWKLVDPGLIFARNDKVRFRYRANFAGYLYVVNRSTSGKIEQLFPREETGQDNRIAAGKEYTIPATDTVFRIAGPAGHELIYWLASPVELTNATAPAPRLRAICYSCAGRRPPWWPLPSRSRDRLFTGSAWRTSDRYAVPIHLLVFCQIGRA